MLYAFLVTFPIVLICFGGWLAYEIYNAPECDENGNVIKDATDDAGAAEGDFNAVLRNRERQAP